MMYAAVITTESIEQYKQHTSPMSFDPKWKNGTLAAAPTMTFISPSLRLHLCTLQSHSAGPWTGPDARAHLRAHLLSRTAPCPTQRSEQDEGGLLETNPQDAQDASLLPNISVRVPLAAHIGGGRLSEVCSIVEWRAPLFSSHLLQLFGRQGSRDSIASATPLRLQHDDPRGLLRLRGSWIR